MEQIDENSSGHDECQSLYGEVLVGLRLVSLGLCRCPTPSSLVSGAHVSYFTTRSFILSCMLPTVVVFKVFNLPFKLAPAMPVKFPDPVYLRKYAYSVGV